ncbi:hypothetical protein QUA43_28760 [Microcoleus sp. N9_B4]|uniref:hypothetical protein n=1 Tax=Microcoleus sp. N9_B4 TaxID=3055386 RepID=UPI002FCF7A8E
MTKLHYNLQKVSSHNQLSGPRKNFSVPILEAGVLLLIIASVGLAVVDPTIRPQFLELTQIIVVAFIRKHG